MQGPLVAFVLGVALILVAYLVTQIPPPIKLVMLIVGWILAIVGGVLLLCVLLGLPAGGPAIAFALGVAFLVIAYTVAFPVPPVRTLFLVLGWILAVIGGVFWLLELLGVPIPIGAR